MKFYKKLLHYLQQYSPSKKKAPGCPGSDLVLTYLSGFYTEEEEQKARQHFSICPFCVDALTVHQKNVEVAPTPVFHIPTLLVSILAGIALWAVGSLHLYYEIKLAHGGFAHLLLGYAGKLFIVGLILLGLGIFYWSDNNWKGTKTIALR